MTRLVNGGQFVAVAAGSNIPAFSLRSSNVVYSYDRANRPPMLDAAS